MIRNLDLWLKNYLIHQGKLRKYRRATKGKQLHILFTLCDHYEPYWNKVSDAIAFERVEAWQDNYPSIAARHIDSLGSNPKHCFFYPEEEYKANLLEMVAGICRNGFGEVEIHLHHDNDTSENLRKTLTEFKKKLFYEHGLLSCSEDSSVIRYGFIHGNWALDNSRPDGRWCGVNNELDILNETGCYADFTMPSAPDITQTSTINSIYYATDDPERPKSHDKGFVASCGTGVSPSGLLCIQGPLAFNLSSRKLGLIPRIENSCFAFDVPVSKARIRLWIERQIHVDGRPDVIFVKLHTHGAQEKNIDFFFRQGGLDDLYTGLEKFCLSSGHALYYVSTRQMYNVVKGLEKNCGASVKELLDQGLMLLS